MHLFYLLLGLLIPFPLLFIIILDAFNEFILFECENLKALLQFDHNFMKVTHFMNYWHQSFDLL